MHELTLGQPIIPPRCNAATTLALLHTYRGPLPKRLVGQASQATNIPCLWNKSFLPCLSKPAKIDFEAMGMSTSEIKRLRNYNYQRMISAMVSDPSCGHFVLLTDQMLNYDATKRPNANIALQHPYFSICFPQPPRSHRR